MRRRKSNPDAPDLDKAVENYQDFHQYTPREIGTFVGLVIPEHVVVVGEAEQTLYRSDKWENKNHEYFHDHDPGVNVGRTDAEREDGTVVNLPRFIKDATALSMLGQCIGFSYIDNLTGEVVEAKVPAGHELYEVPNRRALLVIDVSGRTAVVKAILWGGKMVVTDRGIVG